MDDLFLPLLAGCLVALVSALGVVALRRPVYAAMALLVHSLSLAALFAILGAGMVAVGQLVIYSGAIVVLFLFVVTLLPLGGSELRPGGGRIAAAIGASGALLAALAAAMAAGTPVPRAVANGPGSVHDVGFALFGPLLLAFEFTAPLLLVAIVSAVALWRRHEPQLRTAPRPTKRPTPDPRHLVIHR